MLAAVRLPQHGGGLGPGQKIEIGIFRLGQGV